MAGKKETFSEIKGALVVSSRFLSKISGKIIGKTVERYAILVQKQYPMPAGLYAAEPLRGRHWHRKEKRQEQNDDI